jgi:uncharacterized protein involved in outer membrane biogenesis
MLVALVVIVPLLFDVDRYRPQVTSLIQEQWGMPAEIGHLALTVFPILSIRVQDFALKNTAGFPQGYFVKAQRLYAVVDAGGLWHHQVVIKSLDLDAPVISLLSDGKGNWNFQSSTSSAEAAPDPPGQKPLFTLGTISNINITRGQVSVRTLLSSGEPGLALIQADGVSSQLRQVDLSALSIAYAADQGGKLVAEGTLKTDSLQVMNLVVTNLKSKLRFFPKLVIFDGLDFKCYDGHTLGNLSFSFAGENTQYSTDAKLDGVNVAKLLDAFPEARGTMTGTLKGTVKLNGEVSHSPDPLARIHGSGQLTVRNGKFPRLRLNKDLLELARLAKMGPASGDPGSFSSITIDFAIANNRINTPKATIVGNGVDMDVSGSLALAGPGSLDYQGVARVAAQQNALTSILGGLAGATLANGKMAFQFNLAGTLQNPIFTLNSGGTGSPLGTITGRTKR